MHTKIHAWKFCTHTYFQSDRAALGNQEYIAMGVSTCTWYVFQDYKIKLMLEGAVKWRNQEASWPEDTENVHIQASFCCSASTHTKAVHFASNVSSSFLTMLVCSLPFKSRQNWLVTYLIICHILMSLIQTTGHKMAALTVTACVFATLFEMSILNQQKKKSVYLVSTVFLKFHSYQQGPWCLFVVAFVVFVLLLLLWLTWKTIISNSINDHTVYLL